jgi:2-methylcitrate dehydratase PrpD
VSKQQDAAFAVADTVVNTGFGDLPPKAIEVTKNDILDTLGTCIAGSTSAAASEIVELARDWGGKQESTIVAFGDRVPAPTAAFINATMGHALDYDDTHDKAVLHVGPATISSALSLAERAGNVDGKKLITAVALGADLICRMGLATTRTLHESGFMFTPLYGYFGSAAAAAKILGLDKGEVINAFGITYAQASGNVQVNIDDEHALTKRLQVGFASKAGVMAALLAQKGLTGAQNSMEGRFGVFNLYQRGEYNRDALLDGLGQEFEVVNLSFKPYSCCRQIHAHVDAALQLKRDYQLEPDDIEKVSVFVNADPHPLCDPLDLRRRPQEEVHAQFSIPYSAAVALTYGKVLVKDYTRPALKDEAVLAVADRVSPVYDSSLPTRVVPPARMEIVTADGRTLVSDNVVDAKGHPDNPMSFDELADKFRDCATHSANPLPQANVEKAIELCANLEDVSDVSQIVALLAPGR